MLRLHALTDYVIRFYDGISSVPRKIEEKKTKSTIVNVSCPSLSQQNVALCRWIGNSSHLTSSQISTIRNFKINCMLFNNRLLSVFFFRRFQPTSLPTDKQKHTPFYCVKPLEPKFHFNGIVFRQTHTHTLKISSSWKSPYKLPSFHPLWLRQRLARPLRLNY